MQTSREIVSRTLSFNSPERVARSFHLSDFVWAAFHGKTYETDWQKNESENWFRFDEWGNLWGRLEDTSKGEVTRGAISSFDRLDEYQFPDFSQAQDYADVHKKRTEFPHHWLIGNLPGFTFNIARKMRKMDQYLFDLAAEPEKVHQLNDRVDEVLQTMIIQYAQAGVDSVMFPEDWGTQLRTFISPRMWRKEFFPRFQNLCTVAHQHGIKVFMHSCGQISAIMPDLIQAGIDLFQFDQPDLHGIETLAAYQQDAQVTFWCPVDIQKTLQTKNEAVIRAKVQEMLAKLWRGKGGFIAGYYEDNASIGLDPKWQEIANDEFIKAGIGCNFSKKLTCSIECRPEN